MKNNRHKKTIIINSAISVILITAFISILVFILGLSNASSDKIRKINHEITDINNQTRKNNKKLIDINRYEENWSKLSEQSKSTKVLRSNEVKKLVAQISQKHHIKNIQFAMNVATKLPGGQFNKKSIKVFLTSGTISFGASDDVRALKFIKELFSSLPGNIIIGSLSLTKIRNYSDKDYIAISRKGGLSKIKSRVKFYWYSKREI